MRLRVLRKGAISTGEMEVFDIRNSISVEKDRLANANQYGRSYNQTLGRSHRNKISCSSKQSREEDNSAGKIVHFIIIDNDMLSSIINQ